MVKYLVKTPWWLRRVFPSRLWSVDTEENVLYLTFDDGPHPGATNFVLDKLREYGARATFFCIGKNVIAHPEVYRRIVDEGHAVGNHTQRHLNGWKTSDEIYLNDVREAAKHIDSGLFRPPYGRITSFQAKHISNAMQRDDAKIVMWDVISGDFDHSISKEQCLQHVILNATRGSIVVFHDSEKAFERMQFSLPLVLDFFGKKGFRFESLRVEEKEITQ